MIKTKAFLLVAAFSIMSLLFACGGGGKSSTTPNVVVTTNPGTTTTNATTTTTTNQTATDAKQAATDALATATTNEAAVAAALQKATDAAAAASQASAAAASDASTAAGANTKAQSDLNSVKSDTGMSAADALQKATDAAAAASSAAQAAADAKTKYDTAVQAALDAASASTAAQTAADAASAAAKAAQEAANKAAASGDSQAAADAQLAADAAKVKAAAAASEAAAAQSAAASAQAAADAAKAAVAAAQSAADAAQTTAEAVKSAADAKATADAQAKAAAEAKAAADAEAAAEAKAKADAAAQAAAEAAAAEAKAKAEAEAKAQAAADAAAQAAAAAKAREVIVIQPNSAGQITINGEAISPSKYDPAQNSSAKITAVDSSGNTIPVNVDSKGDIIFAPAENTTIAGTYTVTIDTGERIYVVVISVQTIDGTNTASVTSAVSYPEGKTIAIDLDKGVLSNGVLSVTVSKYGLLGIIYGYTQDSSISEMIIKDKSGNTVPWTVDKVTGDILVDSNAQSPFSVEIITNDGKDITFTTDSYGKITGNVTVSGRVVAFALNDGNLSVGSTNLTLSTKTGDMWSLASNVTILSATAGASDAPVTISSLFVDTKTGNIIIEGNGIAAPSGPYTVRIKVGDDLYIIKADASGNIISVIPGNILLQITDGKIIRNGASVIQIGVQDSTAGTWSQSTSISNLKAATDSGASVAISIDPLTGNLVTPQTITGNVTISFNYKDSAGNTITYTFIVFNGTITSYQAVVTNPGSNFDYSTVTNVTVSLKVADITTGLPVKQASISFIDASGNEAWKGFTDDNGTSLFSSSVETVSKTTNIKVVAAGYVDVSCDVSGVGKVLAFGKNITMTPISTSTPIVDSDGDGIADSLDDYPNDATGAKQLTTAYTFGFEDLYSVDPVTKAATFNTSSADGNDADFNDIVVRMTVVEKIDSQNKVRQIDITTKVLATLAGYTDAFGVYINDGLKSTPSQYLLITNPKSSNQTTLTKTIKYSNGVARATLGAAPYDPFMVPNYGDSNYRILGSDGHFVRKTTKSNVTYYVPNEVHLASAASTPGFAYTGPLTGTGYITVNSSNVKINQGFTWALMLPDGWLWPKATVSIGSAYPKFVSWCNSGGTLYPDWYNYPVSGLVVSGQ